MNKYKTYIIIYLQPQICTRPKRCFSTKKIINTKTKHHYLFTTGNVRQIHTMQLPAYERVNPSCSLKGLLKVNLAFPALHLKSYQPQHSELLNITLNIYAAEPRSFMPRL